MQWGVSYYPELVDEKEWARDLANMKALGLTTLRVLEFAWVALEPREGVYDFAWFDRFLDLVHQMGMQAVVGTPTATPPAWLSTQYPNVLLLGPDGRRHVHGGRRDADIEDEVYRHYSAQIAKVLGQRYGRHPAVVGWQIDNELGGCEGGVGSSHSSSAVFRFRQYLKQVHGDVATLNRRWFTRFWSQDYSDWGEVGTPVNSRSVLGQVLDYSRFFGQSTQGFIKLQYDALRSVIAPHQWISHNSTAVFNRGIDHADWAAELDVTGWDAYFNAAGTPYPCAFTCLAHDLFRSAKHQPFVVFETNPANKMVYPAYYAQMYAHGASSIVMWHWRQHRGNAENELDAVCNYAGQPFDPNVRLIQEITARPELAAPLPAQLPRRKAAFLFCPDCVRIHTTPDPYYERVWAKRVPYLRVVIETYRQLWRMGLAVDVLRPHVSFAGYDLIVVPEARLLSADVIARLRDFVAQGGRVLWVGKSAHMDEWGVFRPDLGGGINEMLGAAVRECVWPTEELSIQPVDATDAPQGPALACLASGEKVEAVTTGKVAAKFVGGPFAGHPAAITNTFGKGRTWWAVGCSPALIHRLAMEAAASVGLKVVDHSYDDVGITPDLLGQGVWIFNHGSTPADVLGTEVAPKQFVKLPKF